MKRKSNILHFRTNRREQRPKGRKGQGKTCPAMPKKSDSGQLIFRYRGVNVILCHVHKSFINELFDWARTFGAKSANP